MDHNVAFVRPDGTITWFSTAVLHCSCLVRVKYFPFDKQYCRLIVASWTYDNTSVTLIQNTENVRKDYFINNGVWDLSSIHKEYQILEWECCPNEWVEAHYLLLFTRQSRYYVITVIVPSTTLSLVSLLVFFMPPDSEEKVTLASSNLLAMLLFQELVSTSMPPIGNQFPLIGSFFVASIVINTFSIFTSIMIMYLHNKDDRPVPSWVQKLAMLKTASKQSQPVDTRPNWVKRRMSGFISTSTISKAVQLHHTQDSSGQNAIGTNLISSKYLELSVTGLKTKAQEDKINDNATDEASEPSTETKEEIVAQWQELSLKVNRTMAFLLTSSVITTALVITFLYIAQEEGDFPERT
ncbi:neuronal acetylcholine receptor subunit alpha-10-like [Lytechinus pictus]|uniref:neuronal acetylcholine receptor subunit alpha-10-like n=1 Tax=Lytechinus pictus TaxID=7653 RepID=UPI0030BA26DB